LYYIIGSDRCKSKSQLAICHELKSIDQAF
jgi:hypothetical protein